MPPEPYSLPWVFGDYLADHPNASPLVAEVVEHIVADSLSYRTLDASLVAHEVTDVAEVKAELCGLLLYYAQFALDDHRLQPNEIGNLKRLRTLLRIEEGEVYDLRPDQLRALLYTEMAWALQDFVVSDSEELQGSRLQGALGLSYDQFLGASRDAISTAIARVQAELDGTYDGSWWPSSLLAGGQPLPDRLRWFLPEYGAKVPREAALRAALAGLEAWERLAAGPQRLRAEESPGRQIPQSVREQVWRRDGGKCVACGSQENLEYDHIIPFSRGGASTFRNVQLLCESCNRRKSARISETN